MQEAGLIAAYAAGLAAQLDFDPALARCVRREVEDHLWEVATAHPGADPVDAQRRAIVAFGDARAIAAQLALVSLAARARQAGHGALLLLLVAFLAMKARLAWYAAVQWPSLDAGSTLASVIAGIDRGAFWVAALFGAAAWALALRCRAPASWTARYRAQLRAFQRLIAVAAAALCVCALCDGILTALRLAAAGGMAPESAPTPLVPIVSMTIEIACVAWLQAEGRRQLRRVRSAERLAAGPDRSRQAGLP